jgi:uncharacterized protein (DUF488 family)
VAVFSRRQVPSLPLADSSILEEWLPAAGSACRWELRLGGFRKLPPVSPDTALRNDSFRAYAAYMRTQGFGAALAEVLAEVAERRMAIMCSETVWWRCRRRLISDHALLLDGAKPVYLMQVGRMTPIHRPVACGWPRTSSCMTLLPTDRRPPQ